MFNIFTQKKDPILDAVTGVMKENAVRRQVQEDLNKHLNVHSIRGLPHEKHAEYNQMLEDGIKLALSGQISESTGYKWPQATVNEKELTAAEKEEKERLEAKDKKEKIEEGTIAKSKGLLSASSKKTLSRNSAISSYAKSGPGKRLADTAKKK